MKNIVLTLLLFMISNLGFGQAQISVKSFNRQENDMTARIEFPKKDQNGDVCAIIKVVTTQTGFSWEPDGLGIVAADPKVGEYWLYVPYGAKRLTIKHPQLGILRDYMYPIPIEKSTVYIMELTSGKIKISVDETIESQWLLISTDPAGADVYINDKPAGKTPYQNELPVGKYTWRLQKELYQNDAGVVELAVGGQKQKIDLKLKPNFGTLQLSTTPESGATVSLNGMETQKITPCIFDRLPSGEHTITVSRDMYETTVQRFSIAAGENKSLSVTMKPTFAGVTITSEPKADIYINGQFKINGSWQGRLSPGVYTFEGKLDKHQTALEKQSVEIGQPLNVTLRPVPLTGNLKVMSSPFEATVKINGKEMGQTPTTIKNMLIGDYIIEISLHGYTTATEKATIAEGQTAIVNTTLVNGRPVTINSTPSGAQLYIDGVLTGTTPYNGGLTFGNHVLRIELNGQKGERNVSIAQSGGDNTFSLSLGTVSYTETVNGVSFDMVGIKGNSFQMGSNNGQPNEKPVHKVTLSDFTIGKTEVTVALFKAFVDETGYRTDAENNSSGSYFWNGSKWEQRAGINWRHDAKGNLRPLSESIHPIIHVSWNDAEAFLKWLSKKTLKTYRLPTEAEWEYAATCSTTDGSNNTKNNWSGTNIEANIGDYSWFTANSDLITHAVGTRKPNVLGLYDMSGNVWEWCSDFYGDYKADSQLNPTGSQTTENRVYRGGSWGSNPTYGSATFRGTSSSDLRSTDLGFRLVYTP